jgi:hypothetical protein
MQNHRNSKTERKGKVEHIYWTISEIAQDVTNLSASPKRENKSMSVINWEKYGGQGTCLLKQ